MKKNLVKEISAKAKEIAVAHNLPNQEYSPGGTTDYSKMNKVKVKGTETLRPTKVDYVPIDHARRMRNLAKTLKLTDVNKIAEAYLSIVKPTKKEPVMPKSKRKIPK